MSCSVRLCLTPRKAAAISGNLDLLDPVEKIVPVCAIFRYDVRHTGRLSPLFRGAV
jgi:hypothetical protein